MGRTRPTRFIINADDLGASDDVNSAIFHGISEGVITSSTLMATGPAFDAAARGAQGFRQASFGVHLNLTEHPPLTADPGLAPLLDANGQFRVDAVYDVRWTRGLLTAVVNEWTAQVKRVSQAGIRISHLDSHNHVHTLPWLFVPLKHIQRSCGIRRVRGTWSIYDRPRTPGSRLRLKKQAWWWALRLAYPTRTTAEFSDFLMFLQAVREGSYVPRSWPESIELMVHPGGLGSTRDEEAAALRSGWIEMLPVVGHTISYDEL